MRVITGSVWSHYKWLKSMTFVNKGGGSTSRWWYRTSPTVFKLSLICKRFETCKVSRQSQIVANKQMYLDERWETLIHSHFLWIQFTRPAHKIPILVLLPASIPHVHLCLTSAHSDATNSSLSAWRLIKPSLLWLRLWPPLLLFWGARLVNRGSFLS